MKMLISIIMSYCNLKYFLTVSKVKQTWSITCIYM